MTRTRTPRPIDRRAFVAGALGTVVAGLGAAVVASRWHGVAAAGGRRPIDRLTLHHTATAGSRDGRPVDAAAIADSHRSRGLGLGTGDVRDCAYHFVILPDGGIQPGRPLRYWGSGTRSGEDNLRSIGVALVGDFSPSHNPRRTRPAEPTAAQLDALEGLALWAFREYGFDHRSVRGHREVSASECPGERCDMDAVRARLAAAAQGGRHGTRPPRHEEGDA